MRLRPTPQLEPRSGRRLGSLVALTLLVGVSMRWCGLTGSDSSAASLPPRRVWLLAGAALAAKPERADAFANAIQKVKSLKTPGAATDIGLDYRGLEDPDTLEDVLSLRECQDAPNCFSTSFTDQFDTGLHDLQPWRYEGKTAAEAMKDVLQVVKAYPPGQNRIDGGGFEIKEASDKYVYAQFESLVKGYIDDVEFAAVKPGQLFVRSQSRNGYTDQGVNAIRLNRIARDLVTLGGWTAPQITKKTHPRYWTPLCTVDDIKTRFQNECAE